MKTIKRLRHTRRDFLKQTATATAAVASARFLPASLSAQAPTGHGSVLIEVDDAIAGQRQVQWATAQLREALKQRGVEANTRGTTKPHERIIVGHNSASGRAVLNSAGVSVPEAPESIALVRGKAGLNSTLLASGSDVRGIVFGLLELADRVNFADDALTALKAVERIIDKPANAVRSMARLFTSDVEDTPWFNDRAFWQQYLTLLATQRFNRFNLTLGIGYDFTTSIRDCYFHFAYPFLLSVSGYNVRANPLSDAERDRNLEMLQFISDETARRGLHFQLGLWTHAYKWTNSPNANYIVEGLTPETHAAYCRDALAALLKACPAISGVTFRIHGESGVPEASYEFWRTLFDGVVKCGRKIEIDMHAKGMDQAMIDVALATGMPVNVSPKFWAEHMGLGYMQGAIRPLEMPPREARDTGFFAKSSGSRSFLRYGYGDLLAEDRRHGVLHRIWPGTQRLLLWGDPDTTADYGRASSFCGSVGVELCEPLSFKGRKGSGLAGGRDAYSDESLKPRYDFEKYLYTYRVWGQRLYNPDGDADGWRRFLQKEFGPGAQKVESALSAAGKILPLVTTAHCPSAANNNYWPELYTNMPVVDARKPHPYGDTLNPKRFGAVSSLDPEFFLRVDDFADELLKAERSGKYSPAWVAEQLTDDATKAETSLREAKSGVSDPKNADWRRLSTDVAMQIGLGRFFAWKLRAALLFRMHERTGRRLALEEAIGAYRKARSAWAELADAAKGVYRSDITFGFDKHLRGHWLDRLPAIDGDIADMEKLLNEPETATATRVEVEPGILERGIREVLGEPRRIPPSELSGFHLPPKSFARGKPLTIEATLANVKDAPKIGTVRLRYRRVNQAEVWQSQPMDVRAGGFHAAIPAEYTDSPFPLQYHFEVHPVAGTPWLHPGLRPGWQGQPYFVVRRA